jgi:hypothetical protein
MERKLTYEVFNLDSQLSHGHYATIQEAYGCVDFDRIANYEIWKGDVMVRVRDLRDVIDELEAS